MQWFIIIIITFILQKKTVFLKLSHKYINTEQ